MATTDHDSSLDITAEGEVSEIWLDGDVLTCTCPKCKAPMSIRPWLMVADCWRCGVSVELNETQQLESLRILREHERSRRRETRQAAAAVTPTMLPKTTPPEPSVEKSVDRFKEPSTPPPAPKNGRRVAADQVPHGTRTRIRQLYEQGALSLLLFDILKDLPSWLVSMVFHMILVLLLSLWTIDQEPKPDEITLSTAVSVNDLEGDPVDLDPSEEKSFEFEESGLLDVEDLASTESPGQPDMEFESPKLPVLDPVSVVPNSQDVGMLLSSAMISPGSMFSGRSANVRAKMVRRDGGTNLTEAAVNRGLDWLARHQFADGHWGLHNWDQAPGAKASVDGRHEQSDTAATALALLPFLGAGHTHLEGSHTDTVSRGLNWLVKQQKEDGDLRGQGNGRMYAHGQCAIALCEAYALTGDSQLRLPAQKALDYIVKAQHPAGGWRYSPSEPGDTSVVGWQLMALRSGKMAYLRVPKETFEKSDQYLDTVQCDKRGGRYAYRDNHGETPTMTAEALLCRQYLGWPHSHSGLKSGVTYLVEKNLPNQSAPNMYYWYYATQVMHHYGGPMWRKWNARMIDVLVPTQRKKGPLAGSWDPRGGHAHRGGRVYMTALAICSLEVYYRHLPMYREDTISGITPDENDDPTKDDVPPKDVPPKVKPPKDERVELGNDKGRAEMEQRLDDK